MKKYMFLFFVSFSFGQNIYIPDPVLKNYLAATPGYHLDTNFDGEISVVEAESLTSFNAGYFFGIGGINTITDFTGLEYFTNLQSIQIVLNQATFLNLNNLSNLQILQINGVPNDNFYIYPIYYSPIVNLNVSGCTSLREIYLDYSSVQNLDLTTNSSLKLFYANYSKLENVDFSGLSLLERVEISFGELQTATFSGNSSLQFLKTIYQPNFQFLDLTGATSLLYLYCQNSNLNTLKVNNLSNLNFLDCHENQITELNLSGLSSLETLDCQNNQIDKLNFSDATEIIEARCNNNLIEELIITPASNKLYYMECSFNKIKELNFENLGNEFKVLGCKNNLLEELNVGGTDLRGMDCSNNSLTSLDLEWVQNLEGLDCSNNQIQSINMRHVIKNPYDGLISNESSMKFDNNPLMFACVDDFQVEHYRAFFSATNINGVDVSATCEFEPTIYPNPIGSILNIKSGSKINSLNIYDVNGRLVLTKLINANFYSNSISELQSGLYILEINYANNNVIFDKIIKN